MGLVNQGLHTAKPAESTPASEPASSLVTEPVNLAPDFVGMDYDSQVRNNHSYAGDYLFYVTMEYSDTVEKGKIIRQTPEAGEVIEKGSTIDLVVSRGPQMVEMPNVAGFTRDGAEQQLAQVGLNASFYPIYNDGSYVSGCVAYCSEEPGAMVEVGSTIIVYMAAEVEAECPPPRPRPQLLPPVPHRLPRRRSRRPMEPVPNTIRIERAKRLPERAGRFFDENA